MHKENIMLDKTDFIIKETKDKRRKNGNGIGTRKIYRVICDFCGEPQGYSTGGTKAKDKKNYCKKCQYEKLSRDNNKQIVAECFICGKKISRTASQWDRAEKSTCSNKCTGLAKRKDITEVSRSRLKIKMIQEGIEQKCVTCGTDHLWNLQAHHIVFVCNGGTNDINNLEFQCRNCHGDIHHIRGKDDKE